MIQVTPIALALQQIQAMATEAAGNTTSAPAAATSSAGSSVDFAEVLQHSLTKISGQQDLSDRETKAFEVGVPNASLNSAMIDGAKAGIMFQESLQVRNRLVSAYTDIMQTPL